MPRVALVGSVAIYIYAGDHAPPHFHARNCDSTEAVIEIESLAVKESNLSTPSLKAVLEWAEANQELLRSKWNEMQ